MPVTAVFFDVGETLIDETRQWGEWADWIGVPRLAFFAALGAVIARGEHHRRVFDLFGVDYASAWAQRQAEGYRYGFTATDFYPDAIPCLAALKAGGYFVGIAGNQYAASEAALRSAGVAADCIGSSERWGVEKPAPAFFVRLIAESGRSAEEVAYVGDRLDNDVLPAKAAGMRAVFIRRGPWGYLRAEAAGTADVRIASLADLPEALAAFA